MQRLHFLASYVDYVKKIDRCHHRKKPGSLEKTPSVLIEEDALLLCFGQMSLSRETLCAALSGGFFAFPHRTTFRPRARAGSGK